MYNVHCTSYSGGDVVTIFLHQSELSEESVGQLSEENKEHSVKQVKSSPSSSLSSPISSSVSSVHHHHRHHNHNKEQSVKIICKNYFYAKMILVGGEHRPWRGAGPGKSASKNHHPHDNDDNDDYHDYDYHDYHDYHDYFLIKISQFLFHKCFFHLLFWCVLKYSKRI